MANKPPVIFLAFANYHEGPTGYLRNLPEETVGIERVLEEASLAGLCELVVKTNATIKEIIRTFQRPVYKDRIAIFHFGGHAKSYALQLENPFRGKDLVYPKGFSSFLGAQRNLKVVFLNACVTADQAKMICKEGIPAVISTSDYVDDGLAKEIAVNFYTFLGLGDPLEKAYNQSIDIVKTTRKTENPRSLYIRNSQAGDQLPWQFTFDPEDPDIKNWNLPLVSENPLYNVPNLPDIALPQEPFPGLEPYTASHAPVFKGRDYDIKDLYQLLTQKSFHSATLLWGSTGVGKTSLLLAGLIPRLENKHQVTYIDCSKDPSIWKSVEEQVQTFLSKPTKDTEKAPDRLFIIVLDHNEDPNGEEFITLLKHCKVQSKLRIVISIRSNSLKDYERLLSGQGLQTQNYYLGPMQANGIIQILHQFADNEFYRTTIEPELAGRLHSLLSIDSRSSITTPLQIILHHLWKKAKSNSYHAPHLTVDLFEQNINEKFWRTYIQEQLKLVDPKKHESGLSLNFLYDSAQSEGKTQDQLASQYNHVQDTSTFIQKLFQHHLISDPATDKLEEATEIRLVHSALTIPVLNLNNESQLAGQQARRTITYTLNNLPPNAYLGAAELQLVKTGKMAMPALAPREEELIQRSTSIHERKKKRKNRIMVFKTITTVLLIGFGTQLNDPYLLLYILLIVILYDG